MTVLEAEPGAGPRPTVEVPPQAYPRGRWTAFKNPFVKRGQPGNAVAPVQGELLLDLVKPIRNDLSDSDLEVVPASQTSVVINTVAMADTRPGSRSADPLPAMPSSGDLEPAKADWARMRDQYFGLEKY